MLPGWHMVHSMVQVGFSASQKGPVSLGRDLVGATRRILALRPVVIKKKKMPDSADHQT